MSSAANSLKGDMLDEFIKTTNSLYIENMKRVRDDVEWFINKFDHKYIDEPWKNAKDSLVRAMIKDGSYIADEPGKKNNQDNKGPTAQVRLWGCLSCIINVP